MMRGSTSLTKANTTTTTIVAHSSSSTTSTTTTPILLNQQRHASRYLTKDFVETRQPKWLSQRMMGTSFQEERAAKGSCRYQTLLVNPRQQFTWVNDTNPNINPFQQGYSTLHKDLNTLLGRQSSLNSMSGYGYVDKMAPFELETDLRYRGADRNMAANIF